MTLDQARARLDALTAALEDDPVTDHVPARHAPAPATPAARHQADREGWREALCGVTCELPPHPRLVAHVLTLGMQPGGHLDHAPGRNTLAVATGLDAEAVDAALDHLDAAGWLIVTRSPRYRRPTAYQAACPSLDAAGQVR